MKLLYEQVKKIKPSYYGDFEPPIEKAYLLDNGTLRIGFYKCYFYYSKSNWFVKNDKIYAKDIFANIVERWKIIDEKGDD